MTLAWHFVADTLRDGTPVPDDGVTLRFDGKPILCQQGLHASLKPHQALKYAPGDTLCLVRCGGTIIHGDDKLVCTERTIIARMDATEILRHYTRMQALSVVHLWSPPDFVLDYLMTGDEAIREAARAAAWAAAWAAAGAAAWDAAMAAVRAATRAPAGSATRAATRAPAGSATRAAAGKEFDALVHECFEGPLSDITEELAP